MITCTRRIQFCAGHRVHGHEGKCRNMHGHNYVALLTARGMLTAPLDAIGRVIDFSVLKERLGGWIDQHWDHGFIYWKGDTHLDNLFHGEIDGHKSYAMPNNPTAENMAEHLLTVIAPEVLKGLPIQVTGVRLWETENCYADAEL